MNKIGAGLILGALLIFSYIGLQTLQEMNQLYQECQRVTLEETN